MNFKLTIYPEVEKNRSHKVFLFSTMLELEVACTTSSDLLLFLSLIGNTTRNYSGMFIKERLIDDVWYEIEGPLGNLKTIK